MCIYFGLTLIKYQTHPHINALKNCQYKFSFTTSVQGNTIGDHFLFKTTSFGRGFWTFFKGISEVGIRRLFLNITRISPEPSQLFLKTKPIILNHNFTLNLAEKSFYLSVIKVGGILI